MSESQKIIATAETAKFIPRPKDRLTVTVKGQPKELFMSSGLTRTLAALLPSLEDVANMFIDAIQQEVVLRAILVDRTASGEAKDLNNGIDDYEISEDDCEKIITWVGEHLHAFFINMGVRYALILKPVADHIESQGQSSTGTKS